MCAITLTFAIVCLETGDSIRETEHSSPDTGFSKRGTRRKTLYLSQPQPTSASQEHLESST